MRGSKIKINEGDRFGRLVVIKEISPKIFKDGRVDSRMILCSCDCGNNKNIRIRNLISKLTKSCGCQQKEIVSAVARITHTKHGHSIKDSKIYRCWKNMKDRCLNPKNKSYQYYGGRGIKICDEWLNFENFLSDMIESPQNLSIDRIDTNGNYCKSNCRWATNKEQANNKRNNK